VTNEKKKGSRTKDSIEIYGISSPKKHRREDIFNPCQVKKIGTEMGDDEKRRQLGVKTCGFAATNYLDLQRKGYGGGGRSGAE